ncbi:uncharacterized protein LOC144362803 [Saccoglossus kowalevskii]
MQKAEINSSSSTLGPARSGGFSDDVADLEEKWQCISFILFLVGLMIGSLIVGVVFGVHLNSQLSDAYNRHVTCEKNYTACKTTTGSYAAIYGAIGRGNECHNYVTENCDILHPMATITCTNFNINIEGSTRCYHGNNNLSIHCADGAYTMYSNCTTQID